VGERFGRAHLAEKALARLGDARVRAVQDLDRGKLLGERVLREKDPGHRALAEQPAHHVALAEDGASLRRGPGFDQLELRQGGELLAVEATAALGGVRRLAVAARTQHQAAFDPRARNSP
jgi:hypothetical protein